MRQETRAAVRRCGSGVLSHCGCCDGQGAVAKGAVLWARPFAERLSFWLDAETLAPRRCGEASQSLAIRGP